MKDSSLPAPPPSPPTPPDEEEVVRIAVSRMTRDLSALGDRVLRQFMVTERLKGFPPSVAVSVMATLWRRAAARDPLCQELLLDLATTRPLEESLGYERVRHLYGLAVSRDLTEVARLFFGHAAASANPVSLEKENEKLASEPLGRRRALARGSDRMKLDRLLFDRNPMVVRNLLNNPRVTERDVVRIAAMRPAHSAVLHEIHRHPRWIASQRVKKALCLNPYTPADIAISLLVHLLRPDLMDAARSDTLHPSVKGAARELLEQRDGRRSLDWVDPPVSPPSSGLSREELERALEAARSRKANPNPDAVPVWTLEEELEEEFDEDL